MLRATISTLFELAGLAAIVAGLFELEVWLGLIGGGASLVLVGFALGNPR